MEIPQRILIDKWLILQWQIYVFIKPPIKNRWKLDHDPLKGLPLIRTKSAE